MAALLGLIATTAANAVEPDWDRAANIKDAATRLGVLHRQQGSKGVLKFLDACYRTHMLASAYSQALESCMAQDYMHSNILAQIHARMPDSERQRLGAPSPEFIARTMNDRFAAAFGQYKMTTAEAQTFRKLVDTNGMPVFLKVVFPKGPPSGGANGDAPKSSEQAK